MVTQAFSLFNLSYVFTTGKSKITWLKTRRIDIVQGKHSQVHLNNASIGRMQFEKKETTAKPFFLNHSNNRGNTFSTPNGSVEPGLILLQIFSGLDIPQYFSFASVSLEDSTDQTKS